MAPAARPKTLFAIIVIRLFRVIPLSCCGKHTLSIAQKLRPQHDPEKWPPVFRQDHAARGSMIQKSGHRFSDKIMLHEKA
jgi:hypothetical protein